jgi:hypothetical protein
MPVDPASEAAEALPALWQKLAQVTEPDTVVIWVRTEFELGRLAKPDSQWDMMEHALTKRQTACLPYLHAAGWEMTSTDSSWTALTNLLCVGQWPYPELIAPKALEARRVLENIGPSLLYEAYFNPSKDWISHLKRLDSLPFSANLKGRFTQGLACLADIDSEAKYYAIMDSLVDFMAEREWIDCAKVLECVSPRRIDNGFCQWWSGVISRQLDEATPPANHRASTARL